MSMLNTRIILRNDSTINWNANIGAILLKGEIGIEFTESGKAKIKIGDGVKTWEQLEYFGGTEVFGDGKSVTVTNGEISLVGFEAAAIGAQPRKKADGTIEWVVPSTETVDGLKSAVAGLQSDMVEIQSIVAGLETNVSGVMTNITNLETNVTNLETNVTNLEVEIKNIQEIVNPTAEGALPLLTRVETLEEKMDGNGEGSVNARIDAKINEFANKISDDGTVNTLKELIDYVAEHGEEVAGILVELDKKVDKVEGMGLSSNDFTDALLVKLEGIEAGAQVNVIENISVAGTILDIVNKTVDIPVAGLDNYGVVKSSTGANKVNVATDGTMSVNKIDINSVVVPIGEEIILNGGNSTGAIKLYTTRIGNYGYASVSEALNHADNGDVVVLTENINLGSKNLVVNAENVTIDLAEKTVVANGSEGAIKVEGGLTTLSGNGNLNATLGADNYSMAIWAVDGTVVINDGLYTNATDGSDRGTDLVYASRNGKVIINGGIFEAANPEWTLNCKDVDYKAGTANIIVKGGKFKNFDPSNSKAEGAGTNFVAEGYHAVKDGDYYVVKPL